MTLTKIQNAPNVIIQSNEDHTTKRSDYGEPQITNVVNYEYANGATTVTVKDIVGNYIGAHPRVNPNA